MGNATISPLASKKVISWEQYIDNGTVQLTCKHVHSL